MSIVNTILSNLVYNEEYFRVAWPHLKTEYFETRSSKIVYTLLKKFYEKYDKIPTPSAILVELESKGNIGQSDFEDSKELIESMVNAPEDLQWLTDTTEKYCQDRAMYNAIARAVEIQSNAELPADERDNRLPDVGIIPDLVREAMSICFDTSVGHDYFLDYEARFESYNRKAAKIPFKIDILNRITKGGVEKKTLNLIMAGVNVGKSLGLCALTADYLAEGKNVVYISMEMSEEMVSKRIDANLMNMSMDDFDCLTGGVYKKKMAEVANRNKMGKLIIKQFPTGGASVNHFNALLEEIKTKKGWVPDVVMVDYLGICASSRIKTFSENSYALVKAIAEELRGFAIRWDVAVWSGAQTNRNGWNSSDIEMGDIAESAGLAATADFILAMMETDEMAQLGQQLAKQIKSRYGNKSINSKFSIGVDKGKQKWYELDGQAQQATVGEVQGEMQQQANSNAIAAATVGAIPIQKTIREKMDEFKF